MEYCWYGISYQSLCVYIHCTHVVNPRRACAAGTVVGSVCLLSHISPLERLFVLKTLSSTQRATKVKNLWGFLWNRSAAEIQHSFRCTASAYSAKYAQLGHRLFLANNRPKATWNTSQCETATYLSLSAALVSASCLSIFRHCNSLRLLPGYIPYTSVTGLVARALSQRRASLARDWHTARPGIAPRVCFH